MKGTCVLLRLNFYFSSVLQCHLEVLDKMRVSLFSVLQKLQPKRLSKAKKKQVGEMKGAGRARARHQTFCLCSAPCGHAEEWLGKKRALTDLPHPVFPPIRLCQPGWGTEDANLAPAQLEQRATTRLAALRHLSLLPHFQRGLVLSLFWRCVFSLPCSSATQKLSYAVEEPHLPLVSAE